MSTDPKNNCLFCAIVADPNPHPGFLWADDDFLAMLTPFPNTVGATVLITRQHYQSRLSTMPLLLQARMFDAAVNVLTPMLERAFPDVGRVNVVLEGLGIDHAHIKLFPAHGTEFLKQGWQRIASQKGDTYVVGSTFTTYPGFVASWDGARIPEEELKRLADMIRTA